MKRLFRALSRTLVAACVVAFGTVLALELAETGNPLTSFIRK